MSAAVTLTSTEVDLSQCENEPVHIPGAIQPHGVLFVLDPANLEVTTSSDNSERVMGLSSRDLLGRPLGSITKIRNRSEIVEGLSRPDLEDRNVFKVRLEGGATFDAIAHRYGGRLLLECEPENDDPAFEQAYFSNRVLGSLLRLRKSSSLADLCAQTAREVRQLTGFDRVLIYMFRPDWSGEVVAEDCAAGDEAYFGLRFPPSDIPKQARALYTACRMRIVPTATYAPAQLVGLEAGSPIDLTHAVLRSISPVHLEYMRNMGVTASLGMSLMRGDQLWGLITCNHESGQRFIPHHARVACGLIGEIVSSLIEPKEQIQISEDRLAFQDAEAQLLRLVAQDRDVVRGLTEHDPSLLDVTHSTGAALYYGGELHCVGATPPTGAIEKLIDWIEEQKTDLLVAESLPEIYAPAHEWKNVGCGLIATPISFADSSLFNQKTWLLWFRPELAQAVSWGGNPNKQVATGQRIHPRRSFELWKEEVQLKSAPFKSAEVAAAQSLALALTDVVIEIEAARTIRKNTILLEESNHKLLAQIEETQKVELELRRAQKLEAIGRLAAGIAHEINTPLQYVGDGVRFVQDAAGDLVSLVSTLSALTPNASAHLEKADFAYLETEIPKALERSLGGLDRVAAIVKAMKSFAQPDTGEKHPADINAAIVASVEIARGAMRDIADVSLSLGELPDAPCYLGDLNQVFLNLLVNATQAIETALTEERGRADAGRRVPTRERGVISIKSWRTESTVCVAITDDGVGIPEAIRESIFLPFFSTKPVGGGTGHGLAIAHAIVVGKHGGSLSVESEVGRGTTFTIGLPIGAPSA